MVENKNEIDLLREENKVLAERVIELKKLIRSVSIPIIPSVIPGVVLIPISGEVSATRFDLIIPELLEHAGKEEIDTVILDFTAINLNGLDDLNILGHYLITISSSLRLVGSQVIVVGINPQFAQELAKSQFQFIKELNTFSTFKSALQFLMKEKGLSLTKKV
ncbi:STAS domain-containing protein [Bacillus sp. FJAT-27445]|uniref:STAS domain-containing protein n=1 Tax=Bacillus sp. FJAT-27445 TaxID=1679166 RepID=UPI0007440A88|nr:STAS domain-containing protein [Bacillus sp. FJAT-27445]